jgi:hypothetical protein
VSAFISSVAGLEKCCAYGKELYRYTLKVLYRCIFTEQASRCLFRNRMVQTKAGAARNEWLKFLRECSSEYLARKHGLALAVQEAVEQPCTCLRHDCGGKIATVKGAAVLKPKRRGKAKGIGVNVEPA